ncbi:MAG: hypothetical protein ACRDQZ_25435 [Mycobacteriales bacterium]
MCAAFAPLSTRDYWLTQWAVLKEIWPVIVGGLAFAAVIGEVVELFSTTVPLGRRVTNGVHYRDRLFGLFRGKPLFRVAHEPYREGEYSVDENSGIYAFHGRDAGRDIVDEGVPYGNCHAVIPCGNEPNLPSSR